MEASAILRQARSQAGVTQRELARRARVPQPAIARIEQGHVTPRVDTLTNLLKACGWELTVVRRPGADIDRSVIRRLLQISPRARLELATAEAANMDELLERVRA